MFCLNGSHLKQTDSMQPLICYVAKSVKSIFIAYKKVLNMNEKPSRNRSRIAQTCLL